MRKWQGGNEIISALFFDIPCLREKMRVWTERANISKVRIYCSGDNLLALTPYKGLDPERNGDGRDAIYPQNRTYSFGLNVEF